MLFPPLHQSVRIKTCGLEVLLFFEVVTIASILYLYWFSYGAVYFFCNLFWQMNWQWTISLILFNKPSELLPAFTWSRAIAKSFWVPLHNHWYMFSLRCNSSIIILLEHKDYLYFLLYLTDLLIYILDFFLLFHLDLI